MQRNVGAAVASCLSSEDPRTVAATIGFYHFAGWAFGAEKLVDAARKRLDWFLNTTDPFDQEFTLDSSLFDVLSKRVNGAPVDRDCLALFEEVLLGGRNPSEIVMLVAQNDPVWIARHGADLISNGVVETEFVVAALESHSVPQIVAALRPVAAIDSERRDEVLQGIEESFSPEKAKQVLSALSLAHP